MPKGQKIAITGGIGSGKSTVAKVVESFGFPVYYSDIEAKKILDSPLLVEKVQLHFGSSFMNEHGLVDRAKLAQCVFNDSDKLNLLNTWIHPEVRRNFDEWCKMQKAEFCFNEAALTFETGFHQHYHKVILVKAPLEMRINRVIQRDNINREMVLARMANQWSQEKKAMMAHYIIQNGDQDAVLEQVHFVLEKLRLNA